MFVTQQYIDAVDAGRKRSRDDEDVTNTATGFGEHRNKRLQSLPFRSSPRPAQQPLPSSIVPLNANPASAVPHHHAESWAPSYASDSRCQPDAVMEMTDTMASPPSNHEDIAFPLLPQTNDSTGRMPTPIQPNFAAQVRGQHGGWAREHVSLTPNGVNNLGHQVTGISWNNSTPRAVESATAWQMLQHHRRLPSPISETCDCGTNGQADVSIDMIMDDDSFPQPSSDLFHPSPPGHLSPTRIMGHPNVVVDQDSPFGDHHRPHHYHSHDNDSDISSPSPPSRRGHQRSKHTVNSWTWQPGMKKSFSIGYRSDCEKCRLKVPGHFNHIVIS